MSQNNYSFMKSRNFPNDRTLKLDEKTSDLLDNIIDLLIEQSLDFYRKIYTHNKLTEKYEVNNFPEEFEDKINDLYYNFYLVDKEFFKKIVKIMIILLENNKHLPINDKNTLFLFCNIDKENSKYKNGIEARLVKGIFVEDIFDCKCSTCNILKMDIDDIFEKYEPKNFLQKLLVSNFSYVELVINDIDSYEM